VDYNQIITPLASRIFQGGTPDASITSLDTGGNLLLVEMAAGVDALAWVRSGDLRSVMYFGIDDSPQGCLSDAVLLGLAGACKHWLLSGNDVFFGCAAGVSRSSYADCATLMATLNLGFDDALALVRRSRPQASPNSGFVEQLRRLEPALRALP